MTKERTILYFLFLLFPTPLLHAQGCSDAGFCSAGSLKSNAGTDSSFRHSVTLTAGYGIGEEGTMILQAVPEVELSFFKNNRIQLKAPYQLVNGNLGNTSGFGDITLSISQTVLQRRNLALSLTLGGKISTGNADLKKGNRPLPMPYQLSLGTHDLILGAALQYRKWNFGAGFQAVMSDKNKNGFLHANWSGNQDAQEYFESRKLQRGADALIRIERSFPFRKFNFQAGLLGIYRVEKDKISVTIMDQEREISLDGSDGLTLNLTGSIQLQTTEQSSISIGFGTPLAVRDVRADGLTRALVLNLSYAIRFGKT